MVVDIFAKITLKMQRGYKNYESTTRDLPL